MPREVDGLLDTIDELVDESLTVGPVDDYNTNRYDKCWHCGRDWHGIPITERIEQMRWMGAFNETYRLADDDSAVLCPGSDFIGPVPPNPLSRPGYHYVEWFEPRAIRELNFSFSVDAVPTPEAEQAPRDPQAAHYVTVDDVAGRRSGFTTVDRFILDEWMPVGRIAGNGPYVRYWDRDFNLVATEGQPATPSPEPTPVRSDAGIPTPRRRERHQLRTRTQQQAQAAQSRRELVERMRSAQPHTTRETP
jgi:hypothetical protein